MGLEYNSMGYSQVGSWFNKNPEYAFGGKK